MNPSVSINGVALFRAGDYGAKGRYTKDDVRRLAESYNPDSDHEASVTIDHAQEGPRYGRISKVYAKGDILFGDLDIIPEFAEYVRRGLYDKRSIEFYRDAEGRPEKIRAVSFLGAQPPEVKGLPALPKFSESPSEIIIFQESTSMDETMKAELAAAFKGAISEVLLPAIEEIKAMLKPAEEMGEKEDKAKMEEGEKPAVEVKIESESETTDEEKEGDPSMKFSEIEAELKARIATLEAENAAARKAVELDKFLNKFAETLTPKTRPAAIALFDALYGAAPVTFSEKSAEPIAVLHALFSEIPAHNLGVKTSKASESVGPTSKTATEATLFSEAKKLVDAGSFKTVADAVFHLSQPKE